MAAHHILRTPRASACRVPNGCYSPAEWVKEPYDRDEYGPKFPSEYLPLRDAICAGDLETLKALLHNTKDLNFKLGQTTPLLLACGWRNKNGGNIEIVQWLLGAGADVDYAGGNYNEIFALHIASVNGNENILTLLLSHSTKLLDFATSESYTPLFCAISQKHEGCTRILLDAGASDTIRTVRSFPCCTPCTALHWAADSGSAAITRLILDRGGAKYLENNTCSGTPLLRALRDPWGEDRDATVRVLIEAGADIFAVDINTGFGALHLAAESNAVSILQTLCQLGIDINGKSRYIDNSPISYWEDHAGSTALHLAAWNWCKETIEMLLDYGAEINAVDYQRRTPLHRAVLETSRYPFPPEDPDQCMRSYDTCILLLEYGAFVDEKDFEGRTPSYYAARFGLETKPILELFLQRGANPNVVDAKNIPALFFSPPREDWEILELLVLHGANTSRLGDKYGVPISSV